MEKQEQMHNQLVEILEKKENESIMREEAWKKQEIERAKMNEQARSQEISRSLALISFIQNTLGQEVQIPKPHNALNLAKKGENKEENLKFDARWPKSEVQALITVRAALNQRFDGKGSKGSIWEDVAADLSSMGYNRTPKKCKEKWDNINKYYRRTVEKGTASKSQVCTYFRELEMLNQTKLSSANSHDENQAPKRSFSSGASVEDEAREAAKWEKITYLGAAACTILAFVNLSKGHPHFEEPPAYPYLHIRNKEFPWGPDGLFEVKEHTLLSLSFSLTH